MKADKAYLKQVSNSNNTKIVMIGRKEGSKGNSYELTLIQRDFFGRYRESSTPVQKDFIGSEREALAAAKKIVSR
jgi:hypothetical protein